MSLSGAKKLVVQNAPSSLIDAPWYGAFVRLIKEMDMTIQEIQFFLLFIF